MNYLWVLYFKVNAIWIQFQCQRHLVWFQKYSRRYYLILGWNQFKATGLSSKVDSTEWTGTYLWFISQRHKRLGSLGQLTVANFVTVAYQRIGI